MTIHDHRRSLISIITVPVILGFPGLWGPGVLNTFWLAHVPGSSFRSSSDVREANFPGHCVRLPHLGDSHYCVPPSIGVSIASHAPELGEAVLVQNIFIWRRRRLLPRKFSPNAIYRCPNSLYIIKNVFRTSDLQSRGVNIIVRQSPRPSTPHSDRPPILLALVSSPSPFDLGPSGML